jgi:hypothetical protein
MKSFVESVLKIERSLSKERGPFSLFALFLREDAPDKWDLVISAPWVESNKEAALRVVTAKARKLLVPPDILSLSRIVIVDPKSAAVEAINRAFHVEHSRLEVRDSNFFGLSIKHAYIFSSTRVETAVAPPPGSPNKTVQRSRRKRARR